VNTTYTYNIVPASDKGLPGTPASPFVLIESPSMKAITCFRRTNPSPVAMGRYSAEQPTFHGHRPHLAVWILVGKRTQLCLLPDITRSRAVLLHGRGSTGSRRQHECRGRWTGEFRRALITSPLRGTTTAQRSIAYMPTSRAITVDITKVSASKRKLVVQSPARKSGLDSAPCPTLASTSLILRVEGELGAALDDASRGLRAPASPSYDGLFPPSPSLDNVGMRPGRKKAQSLRRCSGIWTRDRPPFSREGPPSPFRPRSRDRGKRSSQEIPATRARHVLPFDVSVQAQG